MVLTLNEFHTRIKEERERIGYSQSDLAAELNISRQSISKWERNIGYPNIETLIEISKVFDITIDELLTGDQTLKEKIIKDGKHLKYPRLKLFFDILLIIGIVSVIISAPITLFITPITLIPGVNGVNRMGRCFFYF